MGGGGCSREIFKVDTAPELEASRAHTSFFVSRHDAGSFHKTPLYLKGLFPGSLGPFALLLSSFPVSFEEKVLPFPRFPISCLVVAMEVVALCSTPLWVDLGS